MTRPVPDPLPVEPSLRGIIGIEGILHAIAAEPCEPFHRLVLADFLEEQGHTTRARFIRLQCLDERWPDTATDELRCLTQRHLNEFRASLHPRFFFAGGLAEGLEIAGNNRFFHRFIPQSRSSVDTRRLLVGHQTIGREFDGAALVALLPGLTHVETPYTQGGEIGLVFGSLNQLPHLRHLGFAGEQVSPEAVLRLASDPTLPKLRSLDLSYSHLQTGWLASLLLSEHQTQLTSLRLTNVRFDSFDELHRIRRMRRLELPCCELDKVELSLLLASPGVGALQHLDLRDNHATDEVVCLLARAGPTQLEYLHLGNNVFHADGAFALASSQRLASLRFLSLHGNEIGSSAARAVVRSPYLAGLELLDLSIAKTGSAAVAALVSDSPLTRLHTLRLAGNDLGCAGATAIGRAAQLAGVKSLELFACEIGEAGALALASSAYLGGLTHLDLRYNSLGERGKAAILDRWPNALV